MHPATVGRRVEIIADLDEVVATLEGSEIAHHQRCWADHQSITDPAHATAAAQLRQARRLVAVPATDTDVEHRDLTDYDRMFGLVDSTNEEIA